MHKRSAVRAVFLFIVAGLAGGCAGMIKDKVRENNDEIWNKHKLDKLDEGMSPKLAKETKAFAQKTFKRFPDFKVEMGEMAVDGDYLFVRWTATGTDKMFGKRVTIKGITYSRIDGRKVVEQHMVWNELDAARQMGYKVVTPKGETEEIKLFGEE